MKRGTKLKNPVADTSTFDTAPTKKPFFNIRESALPLAILALLPVMLMGTILFSGTHIVGSPTTDARIQFLYTRFFGFNEVAHLSLPLWNPHVFGGTPFVGTLQSAVFYPLNLLFALFPIAPAMNWSIALHLGLSGIFTYLLLNKYGASPCGAFVAGVVYTFSGPQFLHVYAGHLNALSAMVWTPLMFLLLENLIEKKRLVDSVLLGMAIAMQFLAGQPQYVFYTMIALFLYLLFNLAFFKTDGQSKPAFKVVSLLFLLAVVISIALSAIQILPTMEMTRYSTRQNLSFDWVAQFSFPPGNLITYLIPDFFGDMSTVSYWGKNYLWEMSVYVGIMPLLLVVLATVRAERRIVWFYVWLAIISLLFAFGKYTPLLKIAYTIIPGFHLFRGVSKFIFLNAFSLAVLSGFGVDILVRSGQNSVVKKIVLWSSGTILAVILLFLAVFDATWFGKAIVGSVSSGDFYFTAGQFLDARFVQSAWTLFRSRSLLALGLVIASLLVLFSSRFTWMNRGWLQLVIAAVVVGDLLLFSTSYLASFDSRQAFGNPQAMEFLHRDQQPFRVITPGADANFGMANSQETLGGYDTIMLKRFSEFINLARNMSPDEPELYVDVNGCNRLTDMLNAKYILTGADSPPLDLTAARLVFSNNAARIYETSRALPRAFVVYAARIATNRHGVFQELTRPDFDPLNYAILEEQVPGLSSGPATRNALIPSFVRRTSQEVTIDAELDRTGLLLLGDTWFPGWKARVDGQDTNIYPANYVMRAVLVPAGKHRVEFRYEPSSFRVGAAITLLALVASCVVLVRHCRCGEPE